MGLLSRAAERTAVEEPAAPEDEITLFHRMHVDINCILLEIPEGYDNFCEEVSVIIDRMGTVVPVSPGRPLILLPKAIDRELIAHRLSKDLNTSVLLSFETNNPESVINRIQSLS